MTSRVAQQGASSRIPSPPPDFVGRQHELSWLMERLDAYPVLLVEGLPGSGKSCLMAAFARELARSRSVRWIDCREARASEALLAARAEGTLLFCDGLEALGPDGAATLVRSVSGAGFTALVAATREAPPLGPVDAVRTSELVLGGLDEESGRHLLASVSGAAAAKKAALYPLTGGNPLAIRLLGALGGREVWSPKDYSGTLVSELGRAGFDALLDAAAPAERRTLDVVALLAEEGGDALPRDLLEACAGPDAPAAALARRFLVVWEGDALRMREPVRGCVTARLDDEERRHWEREIGVACQERGDWPRAHDHYCRAGAPGPALRALAELRVALGRESRYPELLERVERTAAIASGPALAVTRARALASSGEVKEALAGLRREREAVARSGDKAGDATLLACQAELLRQSGDAHRALKCGYDALQRGEETGDPEALWTSLELLGLLHSDLGDPEKAAALMKRASAIRGESRTSRSLSVEAGFDERAGRLDSAARLCDMALEISADASERADLTLRLARIALARGDSSLALETAAKARDLADGAADKGGMARACLLLGTIERVRGGHDSALAYLNLAMKLAATSADEVLALLERGEILRLRGDYRGASRDFKKAVELAADPAGAGGGSVPVRALQMLGSLAADRGEYARAGETYRQAMELLLATTAKAADGATPVEAVEKIALLCGLSAVSRGRGEYNAAARLLEQAQRAAPPGRTRDVKSARARVLLEKAALARVRGDYRAGLSHCAEAQELARDAEDRPLGARVTIETASLFRENGDYTKAMETLGRALSATRSMGDRFGVALCLYELARCHQERGEYARASRLHQRGLLMARRMDATQLVARFLNALGHIEADRGHFREALDLYRQARQILRGLSDKKELQRTLGGIADIHKNRREFAQALRKVQECLRLAEELPDPAGSARAMAQLSAVHALMGNYVEALAHQARSLRLKEELGDVRGIVESLTRMARIHGALRSPKDAEPIIDRGLKIAREYELGRNEVLFLEERAALELEAGRLGEAEGMAGDAIATASGLEFGEGLARGFRLMGLIEKRRGRFDISQRHLNRALKHFKRLRRDAEIEQLLEEVRSVGRENLEGLLQMRSRMLSDTARLERDILERHGRLAVLLLAEIPGYRELVAERGVEPAMEEMEREDEVLVPRVLSFAGTLMRHVGDRALARFDSAERALECAESIGSALAGQNGEASSVRIGLHVGVVAEEEGRIGGQVVEVLERLPGLAGPRGIALTEEFRRHLGDRSPGDLEPVTGVRSRAGEPQLRVFRLT